MTDIRAQLPECPLEYEVPHIPGDHTALFILIHPEGIDWQMKMLPWTLASLINNTDLIMKGVHLYITYENGTEVSRIQNAISNFAFTPERPVVIGLYTPDVLVALGYEVFYRFDINHWAFRDERNAHKLEIADKLKYSFPVTAVPYPDIPEMPPDPQLYDMSACTIEQFRHAIKHLMGAQLAMKI